MATMNIEKNVRKKAHKIPSDYLLSCGEINQLYDKSKQDIWDALIYSYVVGFVRGTRAKDRQRVPTL